MQKLYLVPSVVALEDDGVTPRVDPKYIFVGNYDDLGIKIGMDIGPAAFRHYGFMGAYLVSARDISAANHAVLAAFPDVFAFPDNLDTRANDARIAPLFEGLNIPVHWVSGATTYRELVRNLHFMFLFAQRYTGLTGERLFDFVGLDDRPRDMTAQREQWFRDTAASFGFDGASINRNQTLRTLLRNASSTVEGAPIDIGGLVV